MTMHVEKGGSPRWQILLLFDFRLDDWLIDQIGNLKVEHLLDQTRVQGYLEDISAVYGLLNGLRDLGMTFSRLSIQRDDIN